jgi:glycosyltransferase 2 family protein
MGRFKWLIRLLGVGLFAGVLWWAGIGNIVHTLSHVNPYLTALSFVLVIPFVLIKAWRWQVILRAFGVRISISDAGQLYAIGLAGGSFTPGQAGDLLKAWYLKKMGFGLTVPVVSTVVDRLFDLSVVLIFALTGVVVFWQLFKSEFVFLVLLLAVLLGLLVILSNRRWRNGLVKAAVTRLIPAKVKGMLGERDVYSQLSELRIDKGSFLAALGITFLSFTMSFFRVYLLFLALGLQPGLLGLIASASLSTIAGLVPVSVGGIGTRDVTLVVIFGELHYSPELAVGLSTLIVLLNVASLVTGFVVWLRHPVRLEERQAKAEQVKADAHHA